MFVFYDTSSLLMSISNLKTYLSTSDISFMLCIKLANLLRKKGCDKTCHCKYSHNIYVCGSFVVYIWIYGIHWKSKAFDTTIKKVNFSKMIFNWINSSCLWQSNLLTSSYMLNYPVDAIETWIPLRLLVKCSKLH